MLTDPTRADRDRIEAEAAVWLAHLQGSDRTPATEQKFRRWVSADAAHSLAFEHITRIWDFIPGAVELMDGPAPQKHKARVLAGALFATFLAALIGLATYFGPDASRSLEYATRIGEQRSIVLLDGSRISLNTNSAVRVRFASNERIVDLTRGEALFDVRKDPDKPFLVFADDKSVRALGTSFVVRHELDMVAVTLVSGKVEVSRDEPNLHTNIAVLKPGERLTIYGKDYGKIDRPSPSETMAWLRGEVVFNDEPLMEAAREMLRYVPQGSIDVDPSISSLRISGIFKSDDTREFVISVATLHNLELIERGHKYILRLRQTEKAEDDKLT